jgi:hypothetical protein
MSELINSFENLSWFQKLILAIIAPIAWNIYRIIKSIEAKNVGAIILAAVFTLLLAPYVMIFDIVFILINKKIWWLI